MIYITQLLCPQRHCVLAAVWDGHESNADESQDELRQQFADLVNRGVLNPFCGLCKSQTLHCESAVTRWSTMEEALPYLEEMERDQIAIAEAASSTGPRYDG